MALSFSSGLCPLPSPACLGTSSLPMVIRSGSSLPFSLPLVQTYCFCFFLSSVAGWSSKKDLRGYSHFTSQKTWGHKKRLTAQGKTWTGHELFFPLTQGLWEPHREIIGILIFVGSIRVPDSETRFLLTSLVLLWAK
jgi:hypothetical protein